MQTQISKHSFKRTTLCVLFATGIATVAIIGTATSGEAKKNGEKWQKPAAKEKLPTKEFVLKKEVAVNPGGTLRLEADRGSVEVIPADVRQVSVEVIRSINEKYAKDAGAILKHHEVVISKEGNDAVVRSRLKPLEKDRVAVDGVGFDVFEDVHRAMKNAVQKRLKSIRFRVTVPTEYNVKLKTGGQSITCGDLDGTAHCNTSGGGIKLGKIAGSVYATTSGGSLYLEDAGDSVEMRTSGGSIRAGEVRGDVVVVTSGGSIHLGSVDGRVSARTSGGSIRIKNSSGAVEAITSGGSISAAISKQPKADSYFATSGGWVNIELAKGLAFDLEHQGHGRMSSPFAKNAGGKARTEKLNGGGPKLVTKGNVRLAFLNAK